MEWSEWVGWGFGLGTRVVVLWEWLGGMLFRCYGKAFTVLVVVIGELWMRVGMGFLKIDGWDGRRG